MTAIEARENAKKFIKWYMKNAEDIKKIFNNSDILTAADELYTTVNKLYDISDKETPYKPREQKILGIRHNCPICDYTIVTHAKYCSNCGQRIDWERSF